MKTLKKLSTLLSLLLSLGMLTEAQASLSGQTVKIMPFGDSLTAGGYNLNGSYHTDSGYRETLYQLLTEAHVNAHFVGSFADGLPGFTERKHEGHSGWRIDQISAGAKEWVAANQPDIVLLMIGTNDCIQNYDLAHAMDRMDTLIANIKASAPDALIYVATTIINNTPEIQARVMKFNQDLRNWMKTKKNADSHLRFVDMYLNSNLKASDLIDGVHPTPEGYSILGKVWFAAIQ